MKSNYKIIVLISFFLLLLSIGSSISYFVVSMNSMEKQLKTQSLPLSIDNIYTEIQKHMIEPYLVSSMMANDTFLKDWLVNDEKNTLKIQRYLDSIKNKYGMLATFLVSDKSKNYYTENGFIEKITKENSNNQWYFTFKALEEKHEINLDVNDHISKSVIMFINFKIFDDSFHYIGATGVGIKISYIKEMLQRFRNNYKLKVMFLDKEGNIILSENNNYNIDQNIANIDEYKEKKNAILQNSTNQLEYSYKSSKYILSTKYIKELDIYLLVEAKVNDFTQGTKKNFYINLTISLLFTLIIATIIIKIFRDSNNKLEHLAKFDDLTNLSNRRNFYSILEKYISLSKRTMEPICVLFIDIDNFKEINDNYGHKIGDEVLQEIASILKANSRDSDICARWGGEEFVVSFMNTNLETSYIIANKIRAIIEHSVKLRTLASKSITISAGVTLYEHTESIDNFVARADNAMYEAKHSGKNKVCKA